MHYGGYEGLVGDEQSLLLLSPGGTGQGPEDVKAGLGALCYIIDVGGKREEGVQRDTQDLRVFAYSQRLVRGQSHTGVPV